MPAVTSPRGYPYPLDTDPIDVAGDIKKLAEAIDDDATSIQNFATLNATTGKYMGGWTMSSGGWGSTSPAGVGGFQFTALPHRRYNIVGACVADCSDRTATCVVTAKVNGILVSDYGITLSQTANRFGPIPIQGIFTNFADTSVLADVQIYIAVAAATGGFSINRGWVQAVDLGTEPG